MKLRNISLAALAALALLVPLEAFTNVPPDVDITSISTTGHTVAWDLEAGGDSGIDYPVAGGTWASQNMEVSLYDSQDRPLEDWNSGNFIDSGNESPNTPHLYVGPGVYDRTTYMHYGNKTKWLADLWNSEHQNAATDRKPAKATYRIESTVFAQDGNNCFDWDTGASATQGPYGVPSFYE